MEILAITLIAVLCGVEVYCGYALRQEFKQRSEKRTDNRRAAYRAKAYKDLAKRTALKNARQTLWRSLQK